MASNRRGIPATKLARDYGMSLNEFADEVVTLLAALEATQAAASPADRCREGCAAVWAAMTAAVDASALSEEERRRIMPLMLNTLLPFWKKHCAADDDIGAMLRERSRYYLERRDAVSQIKTAANIVNRLLDTIGVAAPTRPVLARTLNARFAHRMLGDVHKINDVRARFGIELTVIAALGALLQMMLSLSNESLLRILRLV
jgi:hypothetical protein